MKIKIGVVEAYGVRSVEDTDPLSPLSSSGYEHDDTKLSECCQPTRERRGKGERRAVQLTR